MQTDVDQPGPWRGASDQKVREAFLSHMQSSAHPEHFLGVACEAKPPLNRGFRIIKKHISVDPEKRDDTLAPCNLCGPKPKFKDEGMLLFDELGWLYLIGPICGEQYYEGRFRDADRRFELEQAKRVAQDFLLAQLSRIAALNCEALALRAHADAAAQAHIRLAKTGKVIGQLRRAASKHDGWLRVDEPQQVMQTDGTYRTEFNSLNLVRIRGLAAVRTTCGIVEKLNEAIAVLGGFGSTEDAAFDRMAVAETEGRLPELAASLRSAVRQLGEVRQLVDEFRIFFGEDNFRAIDSWAKDRRCPIQMAVECQGTTRTLEAAGARRRFPIDVTLLMTPMHLAPDIKDQISDE